MFEIVIEPISVEDIPEKVKWYNDEEVSHFLHYEEKFTIDKSLEWLKSVEKESSRFENTIKVKDNSTIKNIGIIGLFNIDLKNKKAGYYITIGEKEYQGKGLAKKATVKFLYDCFMNYDLEKIYLYTDTGNSNAQALYERLGFKQEGLLRKELYYNGQFIDRYYYGILREEFLSLYLD